MSRPSPEATFRAALNECLERPGVDTGTGFVSSPGLRVGGKIFAMLVRGPLVVKLPRDRVIELIGGDEGIALDPGHGRSMKEWAVIPFEMSVAWPGLMAEAFEFVQGSLTAKSRADQPG